MRDGVCVGLVCHRYPPYPGGLERHVHDLSDGLDCRGIETKVFTSRYGGLVREQNVVELGALKIPGSGYYFWPGLFNPRIMHELEDIDVIHAFEVSMFSALAGLCWARLLDLPCVLTTTYHPPDFTVHKGLRGAYDSLALERILRGYDRVVVHSEIEREALMRGAPKIERTRMVKIEHTTRISEAQASSRTFRSRFGLEGQFVVLCVGRLDHTKGLDDVVKAGECLRRKGVDIRIVHIGPVEEWYVSDQQISSPDGAFLAIGRVGEDVLKSAYSECDVTVVASTYETFSLVAIESLILGTPVIGTRTGIMPEIIEGGKNGYLYNSGDYRTLARFLGALVESSSNRPQDHKSPLISFEKYGRPEREIDEVVNAYLELIG